jgi:hypothetical protein
MPRKLVWDETDVGVFHCINRCVRRAFLCGADAVSGQNFEHRRQWIQDRLEGLAGLFALDVLGFAVMSNHPHVVLRNRPDLVATWSDEEVARRWWFVFPQRHEPDGSAAQPEPPELAMITADPEKLAEVRKRLASVSWFMRCLAEPIARQANREDACTGRFWEGRFKCQPLLDEAAVAACMVYVDLNPMRAGIAQTPETSQFTSAYERIHACEPVAVVEVAASVPESEPQPVASNKGTPRSKPNRTSTARRAEYLSPLELARTHADEACARPLTRASNRGCLPISLPTYLQLLDWTGRQIRGDQRSAIPAELAPVLERLQISGASWVGLVKNFGRMFRRAAGTPQSLAQEAARHGRRWLQGVTASREVFSVSGSCR